MPFWDSSLTTTTHTWLGGHTHTHSRRIEERDPYLCMDPLSFKVPLWALSFTFLTPLPLCCLSLHFSLTLSPLHCHYTPLSWPLFSWLDSSVWDLSEDVGLGSTKATPHRICLRKALSLSQFCGPYAIALLPRGLVLSLAGDAFSGCGRDDQLLISWREKTLYSGSQRCAAAPRVG